MRKSASLGILTLLLFQGCTTLGPDFTPPTVPKLPSSYEQNLSIKNPKLLEWWKEFNDPILNTLVQKAYTQNLDLESAGARILQARSALGMSESLTTPQKKTITASLAGIRNSGQTFGNSSVNFDMGWELDLWGKYARGIESTEATYYASIASYDHILVTLISEVARHYINYRTSEERLAYAKQNIAIQQRIVRMTQVQYNSGVVSELDAQQALSQLYALESLVPSFEHSMNLSANAIAVLLGTIPEKIIPIIQTNSVATTSKTSKKQSSFVQLAPSPLKVSMIPTITVEKNFTVNAADLLQRPDLQVSELQVRAQNAQIGVAQAELYPHFSLFGSIGYATNSNSGDWLSPSKAITLGVGPSLNWNILFDDFYQNQVRIQDAALQEKLINYNQKVLNAVAESSNALSGYHHTKEQSNATHKALAASIRAFNLSSIQYDNGMVTYQRLLTTMEHVIRYEDNLALAKENVALHAISLYKALGGGLGLSKNQSYIRPAMAETMKKRTDWGDYLDQNQTIYPKVRE